MQYVLPSFANHMIQQQRRNKGAKNVHLVWSYKETFHLSPLSCIQGRVHLPYSEHYIVWLITLFSFSCWESTPARLRALYCLADYIFFHSLVEKVHLINVLNRDAQEETFE